MIGDYTFTDIIQLVVVLLVSLVIHETCHAYVGYALGDTTAQEEGRLSLNPLRHIDPLMTVALPIATLLLFHVPILAAKPVPFNPFRVKYDEFGAALIALAGPISNLILAIIAALLLRVTTPGTLVNNTLIIAAELNVALFVFNLIPIPPLDGSRVLYAFAPEALQQFMEQLEPIGLFIIFAAIIAGGGEFLIRLDTLVLNLLP